MNRFFVDSLTDCVIITGEDAVHMTRSLRLRVGDSVMLCDGKGSESLSVIESADRELVTLKTSDIAPSKSETTPKVTLYQALPKGDKSEFIVQKAVELGAVEVVFLLTERCVSRPSDFSKKLTRYQKIAKEAAMQSGRGIVPTVRYIEDYRTALSDMKKSELSLMLYEGECEHISLTLRRDVSTVSLLIGSEGGFSPDEVEKAMTAGVTPTSLGSRILRCETAPIATLAMVEFYYRGDNG